MSASTMTMEKANRIAQQRIVELEQANEIWRADFAKLKAENNRLRETLHQIYSEACFILNSEDDVDAWGFVKSTRDTALQEGE